MKFLSVLLIACLLVLCFPDAVKPAVVQTTERSCCRHMAGKAHCGTNKTGDGNKGCDKPVCPDMFLCSICGFLVVEPVQIQATPITHIPNPIPHHKAGQLIAYHPLDWKPPKTC